MKINNPTGASLLRVEPRLGHDARTSSELLLAFFSRANNRSVNKGSAMTLVSLQCAYSKNLSMRGRRTGGASELRLRLWVLLAILFATIGGAQRSAAQIMVDTTTQGNTTPSGSTSSSNCSLQ